MVKFTEAKHFCDVKRALLKRLFMTNNQIQELIESTVKLSPENKVR